MMLVKVLAAFTVAPFFINLSRVYAVRISRGNFYVRQPKEV
jgi:hypothetical protein